MLVIVNVDTPMEQWPSLDDIERRYITHVIKACNGNKSKAARVLGIDRRSVYRKLFELFGPTYSDQSNQNDQTA